MKTKKGLILDYIRLKPRQWKEIIAKFGGNGATTSAIYELMYDQMIYKPVLGIYEIRHDQLKPKKDK